MTVKQGFAIWITGLPASGKSSITGELVTALHAKGVSAVVLESDVMRRILTPQPTYTNEERDAFYRSLALLGALITSSGTNVIIDATANKRAYRDFARSKIERFLEIYVDCPLAVCINRDPKGIYKSASAGNMDNVPGLQAPYEPPTTPEITLSCDVPAQESARKIIQMLEHVRYI